MFTSSYPAVLKHSLYWLLPVALLNVFTSVGFQEHLVTFPVQAQMELVVEERSFPSIYKLVASNPARSLSRAQPLIGLQLLIVQEPTGNFQAISSKLLPANNLLCFYGKAAPEALDRWSFPLPA